jgi:hypothetical protein
MISSSLSIRLRGSEHTPQTFAYYVDKVMQGRSMLRPCLRSPRTVGFEICFHVQRLGRRSGESFHLAAL